MNGVTSYATAYINLPVSFPDGKVACCYCKLFCRYEENFKRYSCRLTEEWLLNPFITIGERCPLEFKKEVNIDA